MKKFKKSTRAENISDDYMEAIKQEYIISDMTEDELFNFALDLRIVGATLRDYAKSNKWCDAKANYKLQQDNLSKAQTLYDKFNSNITDEQINRYIDEYKGEARNKLIVLAYIESVIFTRVMCTKDTVALAKYEAKRMRAKRKKYSATAEQATIRATETTAISKLAEFQEKMRS